jgi:UDP-N-acetylmuramoyl-tripeptide--D-alanyl-D-alanine ligase
MLALLSQTKDLRWPKEVHLVLGEMRELGQDAESFHLGLSQAIEKGSFDALYLFGPLMKGLAEDLKSGGFSRSLRWTEDYSQLSTWLRGSLKAGDLVILKGSRGVALERLTEMIKSEYF